MPRFAPSRHYIGFETDRSYIDRSKERVAVETERLHRQEAGALTQFRVHLPAVSSGDGGNVQARAVREGRQATDLARLLLESCGFNDIRTNVRVAGLGIKLTFVATDQVGDDWAFDVSGAFTVGRSGLRRADTLWKALGKAAVLHQHSEDRPLVLLTTDAPAPGSAGHAALDATKGPGRPVFDLIELLDRGDHERLRDYARRGRPDR